MTTIDLHLFATIADLGGLTAAARRLGLSKSMVSRELIALEQRLGTRLVQRTTRRIALTETGELLAGYARRVVEDMENAEAAIAAARDTPRGDLKVSMPYTTLRFLFTPHLNRFLAKFPEIRLALDASNRVSDLVDEGIDVAIRVGELPSSSLIARRLAVVPQILVAAPKYISARGLPCEPCDLEGHDIINLQRDLKTELWTLVSETGAKSSAMVTPTIAVLDPGIVMDLSVKGLGIGLVPLIYARDAIECGELVRVCPYYHLAMMPVHAVYPSRRMLAPKVRVFIEFAAEVLGNAL